jgi:CMP-N,N'-diacetyllegionaminic acid synthase
MAWQGMTVLAVVPARGGSKGLPRKNMAQVGGLSLIARCAAVIKALPWIDRAVLSTDDRDFAAEGRRHGLDVPFMRPADLANDTASGIDTWRHAWLEAERHYGMRFDVSVYLQPTSPLRRPEDVERTVKALVDGKHMAATTISEVPAHFKPEKIFTRDGAGLIHFYLPDGPRHTSRQTTPDYFTRNGICYACRRATVVDKRQIVEEDCVGVPITGHVPNIDDQFDLEIARWMEAQQAKSPAKKG